MKTCVECGAEFELLPKKPGLANRCPACSPPAALLPKEAKDAAIQRRSEVADGLFRAAIAEKRDAEARGQFALADEIEERIIQAGNARIKPKLDPRTKKP